MIVFAVIFIIGTLLLLAYAIYKNDMLDEWEDELDKREVFLNEKANKLAKWEDELIAWEKLKNKKQ